VGKCCSPLGLRALMCQDAGWSPPPLDTLWTPREVAENYLVPLARTDLLEGHVAEGAVVTDVRRLDEETVRGTADQRDHAAHAASSVPAAGASPDDANLTEPSQAGLGASAHPLTDDDDAEYEDEEPRLPPLQVTARCGETTRTVDADIVIDASGLADGEADSSFLSGVKIEFAPQSGCPVPCGDAARHGAAAGLVLPEPNFYILGSKSRGRGAELTIADGLRQIRDLFALIGGRAALDLYGVR
jgi:hypothetical protein